MTSFVPSIEHQVARGVRGYGGVETGQAVAGRFAADPFVPKRRPPYC